MLRKILLVVMATVVSYALTVLGGYGVYTISAGRSDAQLSVLVRFVLNPLIALLVGCLVGILSKDHPAWTSAIGLAAWALLVHGSRNSGMISGVVTWAAPIVVYVALAAVAGASRTGVRAGIAAS
jgi:hypothetical protein